MGVGISSDLFNWNVILLFIIGLQLIPVAPSLLFQPPVRMLWEWSREPLRTSRWRPAHRTTSAIQDHNMHGELRGWHWRDLDTDTVNWYKGTNLFFQSTVHLCPSAIDSLCCTFYINSCLIEFNISRGSPEMIASQFEGDSVWASIRILYLELYYGNDDDVLSHRRTRNMNIYYSFIVS